MSLFRVDSDKPFRGPHQNQPIVTEGPAPEDAALAVILIHGRGASAEGMLLFADEFNRDDIHYRALQASQHTWYPRSFLAPRQMNEPGISSGLQAIHDQIMDLNKKDIPTKKIVILGFSQGACLTSEFTARHPQEYGAIVGLSGGLIGEKINRTDYSGSLEHTPVFLGCSTRDPHIPKERVDETEEVFKELNADVNKQLYTGLGHSVNSDEIKIINTILEKI